MTDALNDDLSTYTKNFLLWLKCNGKDLVTTLWAYVPTKYEPVL